MLNGKFYTGLPAAMMDRRKGPNRLKTNFYWPDESDTESAIATKQMLRNRSRQSITPERNFAKEFSPVELHKKELASKIDLDENLPKPKATVAPLKTVEKPTRIKRRDTFTSKIQFYDYDDTVTPSAAVRKPNKNSKIEVEKNLKNSPKTTDKRISFVETREKSPVVSGILKNNESPKIKRNPIRSTPIIKNLSKSKSMTDIGGKNSSRVIENDVKNLSISGEKNSDRIENYILPRRPTRDVRPATRKTLPATEYYDDLDEFAEPKRTSPEDYERRTVRNYNDYDDHYDENPRQERIRNTRQAYSRTVEHRQNNRGGQDYVEDFEYQNYDQYGDQIPKQEYHRETVRSRASQNNDRDMSPKLSTTRGQRQHRFDEEIDHEIDEGRKPNNLHRSANRNSTIAPTFQSQPNRAHRHLVSNISFGDSSTSSASNSIRNTAVTRVSVGLPDT